MPVESAEWSLDTAYSTTAGRETAVPRLAMPAGNDKDGAVEDAGTTNVGRANADEDGESR